jgi:hypothetical protein
MERLLDMTAECLFQLMMGAENCCLRCLSGSKTEAVGTDKTHEANATIVARLLEEAGNQDAIYFGFCDVLRKYLFDFG